MNTSQVVSPQERAEKVRRTNEMLSTLHGEKSMKSDPFFKNCKVTTCSQVLIKNGQAVAVAFKSQSPRQTDRSSSKSLERDSFSQ